MWDTAINFLYINYKILKTKKMTKINTTVQNIELKLKPVGNDGFWELRNKLNLFVRKNFELLYEGAIRLGCNIEDDYYAPRRIQINYTRLHESEDLKYADGHKYCNDAAPSAEQLKQTVKDLQALINAASKNIEPPFSIKIIKNK